MIRTIIADDEQNSIDVLKILLAELRSDITVLGEAHNANEALDLVRLHQPDLDLLFLDVQMPGGDGFSVLERLGTIDFKVIFVTAFDQFAIRAIRFSALDYLLKPVDPFELNEALNHFDKVRLAVAKSPVTEFQKLIQRKSYFDKLAVSTLTDVKFVPLDDVLYLESDNNYTTLHLHNKKQIVASRSIGYYEELLHESGFFRIHNSYLVNLRKVVTYVKGRGGYVALENGVQLEVSVRKKDELMRMLNIG